MPPQETTTGSLGETEIASARSRRFSLRSLIFGALSAGIGLAVLGWTVWYVSQQGTFRSFIDIEPKAFGRDDDPADQNKIITRRIQFEDYEFLLDTDGVIVKGPHISNQKRLLWDMEVTPDMLNDTEKLIITHINTNQSPTFDEIGLLSNQGQSEADTEYRFYTYNGKHGDWSAPEDTFTLSLAEINDFYKRDFLGTYSYSTVDWEAGPIDCHQLQLTKIPKKFTDLNVKFSSETVINLPWLQIPDADKTAIQSHVNEPLTVLLESAFPERASHVPPCYSEFNYIGLVK